MSIEASAEPSDAGPGRPGTPARAPVLLADATWYGTLAAVRDLGAHGVPVVLASDRALAPARWSRFVTRTVRSPSTQDPARFLEWLLAFGEREPGHVYYPTSDSTAWLAGLHREALARNFKLYSPSTDALSSLLDKARLTEEARAAGLDVPEAWCPRDEGDVERLAGGLPYPIMVKPRSQVFNAGGHKGLRVLRSGDLLAAWRSVGRSRPEPGGPGGVPDAELPFLQRCHPASERIYTVDGFVDRSGDLFAALACTKLLQCPRGSGAGVIFEETPVQAAVGAGLRRLFRSIGFHGIFDAEFLEDGERLLLIDVNPRIYNHMDFEVKRGLPLAWLAYLGALDAGQALAAEVREARAPGAGPDRVYVHRLPGRLMLLVQRLSGAMSRDEVRGWERWLAERADPASDPTAWPGDRGPALGDVLYHLQQWLRHPRGFLRALGRGIT